MKRPKYRLQVRLVAVPDSRKIVEGQVIEQAHTLLDLRLDSLSQWASMMEIQFASPRARRKTRLKL